MHYIPNISYKQEIGCLKSSLTVENSSLNIIFCMKVYLQFDFMKQIRPNCSQSTAHSLGLSSQTIFLTDGLSHWPTANFLYHI